MGSFYSFSLTRPSYVSAARWDCGLRVVAGLDWMTVEMAKPVSLIVLILPKCVQKEVGRTLRKKVEERRVFGPKAWNWYVLSSATFCWPDKHDTGHIQGGGIDSHFFLWQSRSQVQMDIGKGRENDLWPLSNLPHRTDTWEVEPEITEIGPIT